MHRWLTSIRARSHWLRVAIRTESGQGLVLFALGLVGFLGLVGMSVDIGLLVYTRTELQRTADAAALAAGQDLPNATNATSTAASYVTKNSGAGTSTSVSFGNANTTVSVTVQRHINYSFLGFIGIAGANPNASASVKVAKSQVITGYNWQRIAPFTIWGGARQTEVNPGDSNCPLHTCVGKSYTFLDTNWMNASGKPKLPDWTASGSNNYKGDLNHGNPDQVIQVGDTFSDGGLGSVIAPTPGEILVIPIVSKVSGNSNLRSFTIGAWAIIKVDPGCDKNACTGTIQGTTIEPPPGWSTSGSVQPPDGLQYKTPSTITLMQ